MTPGPTIILNVDDSEVSRYTKTRSLVSGGFQVVEADTATEALRLVQELRPAIVLLDVKLPDMNGIDVCRKIKEKWPSVLVLQTSASFTAGGDRTRGLDAGADSYLVQPVETQELIASVRALLRIRNAEDALRTLNETLEKRVAERTRALADAYETLKKEVKQRKSTEAQLIQAQKMEAVGQLTGGIAHDFNNLLHVVLGNLDILKRRLGAEADGALKRPLEIAMQGGERAAILTRRLLTFSRLPSVEPQLLKLNDIVEGMSDLLRRTLAASIKIEMNLASDLGWARVDANQLDSAILNLAINSRDAMPDGGTLMIETANIVIDDGSIGTPKGLEAGRYVMVAVIDTGVGMPGDILSRVFEPFFTTKGIGQGTGLGLSQVYGFVKQSGGQVDIVSKVGHGTTVRLFFPRLEFTGDLAQGPDESPPNGRHGGKETIVVVEDDDHVRDYATLILNELGYRVLEAHDAETALGILDSESEISLIFTDIGLVGPLNGYQLMEAARRRKPSLKCLLTTGYVREAVTNRRNSDAKVDLIAKPFSYDELARKIRRVLDRIEQK